MKIKVILFLTAIIMCIQSLAGCTTTPLELVDFMPEEKTYTHDSPPTVYIINDVRYIGEPTNNEDFNDMVRLYTTLQGRLNKNAKENNFFVYQMFRYVFCLELFFGYILVGYSLFINKLFMDISIIRT